MRACKGLLVDLVRRTTPNEQPEERLKDQMRSLGKIKNLEQFCKESVGLVKENFSQVLQKGLSIEQ